MHQNRNRFAIALSDAEGEIEREYERSLATLLPIKRELARTGVLIDKIAGNILPAAQRFFERVEPKPDEEILARDLPSWRTLPPAAPTFLLTGDHNLRTLPEQMDFSTSIIPYTKAVAAHDEVLTRTEAQAMRTWALRMRYSPISL